jgi:hypothetical protein
MTEMIANVSKLELESEFNHLAEEWRAENGSSVDTMGKRKRL